MCPTDQGGGRSQLASGADGARKRAAIETYSQHEGALRRTAQRYSLCADDAEDALQRSLEILLRKAPTSDPRELIRWTQTVVKHEALAVRRERERILAGPAGRAEPEAADWVALIPAETDGPPEQAERREAVARSREALKSLKPQELRALALLAEGYSYAEIGEITGFSRTKINRCLAEGRERFRSMLSRSEDGSRCVEMRPAISAFCDGEADVAAEEAVREHLRACAQCRATMRAYRAAPVAAAALSPLAPIGRSLLGRVHDLLGGLSSRLGGESDSAVSQIAASGGSRGAGMAALAKAIAICAGTAGGAAACAATGVIPVPFAADHDRAERPKLERRISDQASSEAASSSGVDYAPAPEPQSPPQPPPPPEPEAPPPAPVAEPAPASGSVEYVPPPPAPPPPSGAGTSAGGAAGEFGP